MRISEMIRPCIRALQPYSSARDEREEGGEVFLDANENPWAGLFEGAYTRYPDPHQRELSEAVAKYLGVRSEELFVGNGSDEAISLLITLFCQGRRDSILVCPPTYGMYGVSARIQEVGVIEVPLTEEFRLNKDEIVAASERASLLFLCSPNNPTGNLISREEILEIVERTTCPVVVDASEKSPAVAARMKKLGIEEYYPGVNDKLAQLKELASRKGIALQDIAYIGDDLCDLACLENVGFACCPADAVPEIVQKARYVCTHSGGHGAVREVCDLILKMKNSGRITA